MRTTVFLLSLWLWCQRIQGAAFVPSRGVVVRGSVDEIPRGGSIDDDSDDESESEELDTSLASSAVKSAVKKKEQAATAAKKAVKKAVNTKLAKKKSGGGLRIPYILRACLNPLTVFAMTKAYWASLFNLEYGKEDVSQELRSALEQKARKGGSGGNTGRRKMKRGQAKTLNDLPQLNT